MEPKAKNQLKYVVTKEKPILTTSGTYYTDIVAEDANATLTLDEQNFEVEGEVAELTIFANDHGYFLPFADSLAGQETYGAGRYLEPIPIPGGKVLVDFNLAYNPYCAYNDRWSCPLTPPENRLKLPIRAGEKVFHSN